MLSGQGLLAHRNRCPMQIRQCNASVLISYQMFVRTFFLQNAAPAMMQQRAQYGYNSPPHFPSGTSMRAPVQYPPQYPPPAPQQQYPGKRQEKRCKRRPYFIRRSTSWLLRAALRLSATATSGVSAAEINATSYTVLCTSSERQWLVPFIVLPFI